MQLQVLANMEIRNLQRAGNLKGKRVFVRVDFNLTIVNGKVTDDYRIVAALPTIDYLKKQGAKIILATHLQSKGGADMNIVSDALKKMVAHEYLAVTDLSLIYEHISKMQNGEVMLMANLRFWRGEEMKDEDFAADLSKLADVYVNEAFPVCHREHASIVLLPKLLPSYAGMRLVLEIENLSKAFSPQEPFLFILGGAKFATKEPLISKFLAKATNIFIGGALANDFFAQQGYEVGVSLVANPPIIIPQEIFGNPKLILPIDVTVQLPDKTLVIKKPKEISKEDRIVDAGPETVAKLREFVENAKLILWNGPLGIYEEGIVKQTEELALSVAESQAVSMVGGGDTVASIKRLQLETSFDFLSTGGGAMLEFLLKETLPGIDALLVEDGK
jgi:phosphoglycerate kinase